MSTLPPAAAGRSSSFMAAGHFPTLLAALLTTFFHEAYHVSRVTAGDFTTVVAVSGSLRRPVGGWLADRLGARWRMEWPLEAVERSGVYAYRALRAAAEDQPA